MPAETDKRAIQKALAARVPGRDGASSAALRYAAFDDAVNDGPLLAYWDSRFVPRIANPTGKR